MARMYTAKQIKFLNAQETAAIPEEIMIEEILMKLPVKSLVRFRCVCRSWNSLLSDRFIQYQSNHCFFRKLDDDYYLIVKRKDPSSPGHFNIFILSRDDLSETHVPTLPYPRSDKGLHLLGSINGIVCMAYYSELEFYFVLWNPSICLFKKIFQPPMITSGNLIDYKFGFGWDSEANDYRIIVKPSVSPHNIVYSSKADSWIERVDYVGHSTYQGKCWTPSIIVKGCPYWNCSSGNLILKFEVKSNVFRNLILPFAPRLYSLVSMNDRLALIKHAYASDGANANPNMDVYSFDEECRLCSVWSKKYTIIFEDLHSLKYGGEIVFNGKETLYDHKMKEFISDKGLCLYNGFSYTPSLVALKGMCDVVKDSFLPRPLPPS